MKIESQYKVITSYNVIEFEKIITEYMKKGWGCQGGVCLQPLSKNIWLCQAMVKKVNIAERAERSLP